MNDDVWGLVVADMATRRQLGVERYGKPVSAADPAEDWLRHAYEEALDMAVYLKAEILRRAAERVTASGPRPFDGTYPPAGELRADFTDRKGRPGE